MCRVPVTFGGGIMMQKGSPSAPGANAPLSSQRCRQVASIRSGS